MRELKWRRGKSAPEYAKLWGLSVYRVEELSAEAWKRVVAEVRDLDRVTATIGTLLEEVAMQAYQDSQTVQMLATENGSRQESPNAYRRIVVDAGKTLADVIGAKAPVKVDIGTGEATPARAAELARELFKTPASEPDGCESIEPSAASAKAGSPPSE